MVGAPPLCSELFDSKRPTTRGRGRIESEEQRGAIFVRELFVSGALVVVVLFDADGGSVDTDNSRSGHLRQVGGERGLIRSPWAQLLATTGPNRFRSFQIPLGPTTNGSDPGGTKTTGCIFYQ